MFILNVCMIKKGIPWRWSGLKLKSLFELLLDGPNVAYREILLCTTNRPHIPGCRFINDDNDVRASKPIGSFESVIKGLPLMILSPSHINVLRLSSSRSCSFTKPPIIFRVDLISLSYTSPWWEADGWLKIHVIPLWRRQWRIAGWFQLSIIT